MEKFTEYSIWKKTDIIDLPFLPFDKEKNVTAKMINESAKYIRKIKNVNYRETDFEKKLVDERRFIFRHADTLIGLDVSTIDVSSLTYLDQFFFLLKMYPMVLINSFIPKESIKKIALHSYCLNLNYILPIFGPMPFLDKALSGAYYGEDIVKLFKGEVEKIDINNFKTPTTQHFLDELRIRFPQFEINDDYISFQPEIAWLGVSDKNIEDLLTYLFNNNIKNFNITDMCNKFNIDEARFELYIQKSMLFYKTNGEEVVFRLQRKNIYWGFICNLAEQFEKEMIDRDAIRYDVTIDESIGTIKKIDEKIYHKLGNLFNESDSFSNKLFSSIKRLLDTNKYSNVLIIDNGNINGIVSMLHGIGIQENLYEILDYYSVAVKYPNVDYIKLSGQSVLIIIDIINTGKLIKSTLSILKELNCKKIGIFSFIVNQNFDIESIALDNEIELSYLTEKELNTIDEILDAEYSSRFLNDWDLNFKLLWGDVGSDIELKKSQSPSFYHTNGTENFKDFNIYDFSLKVDTISFHSYIYQKLRRILLNKDIVFIYKDFSNFKKLIDRINENEFSLQIKVHSIDEKTINIAKIVEEYEGKKVLFLLPINLMKNINKFISINKFLTVEFLDLVKCEVYFFDNNEVIRKKDLNRSYIFQSKLKRYRALSNNPQMESMDDLDGSKNK